MTLAARFPTHAIIMRHRTCSLDVWPSVLKVLPLMVLASHLAAAGTDELAPSNALPSEVETIGTDVTADELDHMLRCAGVRDALLVVSFQVSSSSLLRDLGFVFPPDAAQVCAYFEEVGEPLVEVVPRVLTNHPRESFLSLDRPTQEALRFLRAKLLTNAGTTPSVSFSLRDATVTDMARLLEETCNVTMRVVGWTGAALTAVTVDKCAPAAAVAALEGLCVLGGYSLAVEHETILMHPSPERVWTKSAWASDLAVANGALKPVGGPRFVWHPPGAAPPTSAATPAGSPP